MKISNEGNEKNKNFIWNLADAKNKFSEVFNLAINNKPQIVSRRGQKIVIINEKSYQKLRGMQKSFIDFLFKGPGIDGSRIKRDKSSIRKVSL